MVLKWNCPDAVGLLARVTGLIADLQGNLVEVHQYTDPISRWFFARFVFETSGGKTREDFLPGLEKMSGEMKAGWTLRPATQKCRLAVLASKEEHCLAELLWRKRSGDLPVEIPVVIGNHDHCAAMARAEGLDFVKVEIQEDNKNAAFQKISSICEEHQVELIVLARFMQILPEWFCLQYEGRILNIHHSFLPAFPGADPYRRALERGVKLIGATCHYATAELDAGPIVEQEVVRVEHFHDLEDLKRHGRDCERLALARGVRFHVEDRVLIHGPRTVVFRD